MVSEKLNKKNLTNEIIKIWGKSIDALIDIYELFALRKLFDRFRS